MWEVIGDVDNYVEPFCGSLAVILGRPSNHTGTTETVNDADSFLCNFWRAVTAAPEEVARWCDWPVNETDLLSRHVWLVNTGKERIEKLEGDPEFYDAKVAGWWVWGINSWIGSGWCAGNGPWGLVGGKVKKNGGEGGQYRQLPHLGNAGRGVNRQLPHLGNAGQGVNRQRPKMANGSQENMMPDGGALYGYFCALAQRLRRVRVCCGDWSRVVTEGALSCGESVGIFFDPPYLGDVRAKDLYRVDDHTISVSVREWAIAHGDDPRLRIVLCGYSTEHEASMPPSWRVHSYSANRSYGSADQSGTDAGNGANRHNERIWFSPGCLDKVRQQEMFK